MADHPTFSESWYRVSALTPRLLGAVKVHRQYFRGQKWTVVQDPANNHYFRLSDAAYHFAAMLDGRRSVGHVWRVCMERFGDAAPTQPEVIDLLGRLHAANLLQGNLAPDAQILFKRYQQRVWREVKGVVSNLFFIRIPLWDPDRFLDRWVGAIGKIFSKAGALLGAVILSAGLWSIVGHMEPLAGNAADVLNPQNLPLLYAAIVMVKVFHEMGHGFSCKHFGRHSGSGGEVHQMGVTLLFFTPLPFVDASSAWALKDKWQRMIVGASGMIVELALASIAAVFWIHSAEGTTVHAIAYNIMVVASVSSLAFNGNPFLRYDAYYILMDLLEIPNLASRSNLYVGYLVKHYVWGISNAFDPSHNDGEKGWLVFYAIASTICRVIVFSAIVLILMGKFFSIGVLLAGILIIRWLLMPVVRLIGYLSTSRELARCRTSAALSCAAAVLILLGLFGLVRMPDRCRIEGVVEPRDYAVIHMQTAGFLEDILDSGTTVGTAGPALVRASSPELAARQAGLLAQFRGLRVQRQFAQTQEAAAMQIVEEKIAAFKEKLARVSQDVTALVLASPIAGVWVAPDADRMTARHMNQGQRIGVVADLDRLRIRAIASQQVASRLIADARPDVEMRVRGRPDIQLVGRIERIIPAGQERLPSAALGYAAGGATRIDLQDPSGRKAAEPFFEILVVPHLTEGITLRPGQTLVLRFATSPKPLFVQAWRSLSQLFQQKRYV